jgi:hypothetical protein
MMLTPSAPPLNIIFASLPPYTRRVNATVAEAVRFHDDQSTYTGIHQNGGETLSWLETA